MLGMSCYLFLFLKKFTDAKVGEQEERNGAKLWREANEHDDRWWQGLQQGEWQREIHEGPILWQCVSRQCQWFWFLMCAITWHHVVSEWLIFI